MATSLTSPPLSPVASRLARRVHLLSDFLAVARAGGIRQAAEHVHVTQSALTRRIQELEQALEVALFERSAKGMSLTPFGKALKVHAEMVEMNCTYAAAEINQLVEGATGELRIAAGPAWAYQLAPEAVALVQREFPDVRVSLLGRMNEATLPMLDEGRLEAVLGGLPDPAERSPELCYEPLLTVEHQVFASQTHPLQAAPQVSPADLLHYPWIWFTEAVSGRRYLEGLFTATGLQAPPASIDTTSVHFGFRVMADGRHLMLLPSTLQAVAQREGLQPLRMAGSAEAPGRRYVAGLMYRPTVLRLHAFAAFRKALMQGVALQASR
ncbi:LysR family transcriptional regulator [Ideonella livida]|uniref:LysR family transcriptional regulator n=1 Tax=Ideonella livida TaxID=2707176 RepID=A0A7C9TNY6_9BURK|nr:LysR family transcriptional regulator [Ideonella livida]NDY93807.1 LysR family transcriptional regulator [Ideonella livida]